MPATVNERAALRTTLFKRNGPAIPLLANARTLARMIATIFGTNDNGVFYDPLDLNSVYQDAAGTSAVSESMQPLGLVLDKSKALKIGDELIPLPLNFNEWTKTAAVTATTNNSFTTSGAGGCTIPIFGSYNTRTYQIRLKGNSTVGGNIRSGGAGSNAVAIPIGNFDIVTTNPAIAQFSQSLYLALNTAGTLTIDSISVKEVKGNHAYQTTSAARPIFRQVTTLGAELASNTAWKTGSSQNPLDILPDGRYRVTCQSTSEPRIGQLIAVTIGKTYEVSVDVEAVNVPVTVCTLMANYARAGGITFETVPAGVRKTVKGTFVATSITEQIGGAITSTVAGVNTIFGAVSVKEITGYRTDRNYIEYDGVDDKLLTTFAAPLTNCTVVRAVPNEGTKILYNQTLPASYEDTLNHSGFFAINRALSNSEKVLLLNEMDKRTGTTSLDSQVVRSFANNEVGVAFNDFNDMSVLFQDAAGTIPVTAVGQPVGLILDKSKGLTLGPELFSDATVTFNGAGGDTVTRLSAGLYRFVSTSNLIYLGLPSIGQAQDRYLLVDYEIVRLASGELRFDNGGGRQVAIPPVVGRRTMGLMATTLTIARRTTPLDCDIRIHSIREVAGNHAYQTVSASRPVLRQTPILGNELIVNGNFSNGITGVAAKNNVTLSVTDGVLKVTNNDVFYGFAEMSFNTEIGKKYLLKADVIASSGAGASFHVASISNSSDILNNVDAATMAKGVVITATTASTYISLKVPTNVVGSWRTFDNVSAKELQGYYTDRNYLEFDGVDDFLQTNNIDFTATDKVSVFAGVRKLSDAASGILIELSNSIVNTGVFHLAALSDSNTQFTSRGTVSGFNGLPSPSPGSYVFSAKAQISSDTSILRCNGVQKSTSTDQGTGNYGNYPLYIGRRGGTSLPFNGHLYSLIIMGRLASDTETTVLENAIAKRVGVTL